MGGIIRDPAHAQLAYSAGADAIVTFPNVYWDMLKHPGTDEWNSTFRKAWAEMEDRGQLTGFLRGEVSRAHGLGGASSCRSNRRGVSAMRAPRHRQSK